jgi:inhibitor of cysteine peptidase
MKSISFLLLALVLLAGCTQASATTTPTLAPISTAETPNSLPEPTDPTELITVKAGETFDLVLPSNSSTGYRWKVVDPLAEGVVQFVAQDYIPERPILAGSGGVDVWTFRGAGADETTITLGYYPPGNEDEPEETVVFSVTVE